MNDLINRTEAQAEHLEQWARTLLTLAEGADTAADYTSEPHHSYWKTNAAGLRKEAREADAQAKQARKLAAAMRAHPSNQCDKPLDEHCPEHDDAPHTRHVVQPEASPMGDVRSHPVPCRGIHDLRDRPMTLNHSALCDRCLNRRPKAWKNRSLSERELIERALDLSESMDDAS